jgi:hypothetical protein
MSEAKHTPGPWKADVDGPFTLGGDTVSVEAITEDGKLVRREICTLLIDTEEDEDSPEAEEDKANARLIAAAPDLLAACQNFLALYGECDMQPEDECHKLRVMMDRAIAKAEGKEATP